MLHGSQLWGLKLKSAKRLLVWLLSLRLSRLLPLFIVCETYQKFFGLLFHLSICMTEFVMYNIYGEKKNPPGSLV